MSNLTDLLSDTISGNIETIGILTERLPSIQENVDLFTPVLNRIDTQIVAIAASIVSLQIESVILSSNAFAVGCGTTSGISTSYPDSVRTYSYNISTSFYDGDDPYTVISSTMNSSNIGFGTFVVHTQNDSTAVSIGLSYGSIDSCFNSASGCTSGICIGYANSISTKSSQINTLRNQLTNLVSSSNKIKTERVDYEIQRFGNKYSIRILNDENTRISLAITTIQINS